MFLYLFASLYRFVFVFPQVKEPDRQGDLPSHRSVTPVNISLFTMIKQSSFLKWAQNNSSSNVKSSKCLPFQRTFLLGPSSLQCMHGLNVKCHYIQVILLPNLFDMSIYHGYFPSSAHTETVQARGPRLFCLVFTFYL